MHKNKQTLFFSRNNNRYYCIIYSVKIAYNGYRTKIYALKKNNKSPRQLLSFRVSASKLTISYKAL